MLQLGLVCLLTVTAVGAVGLYIKQQNQQQASINNRLQQASVELEYSLQQLQLFRLQEQQLQERHRFLAQFQDSRYQALHLFNQLPSWLPMGVKLDSVQLQPQRLALKGQAQSYSQLSILIQQIEEAAWLTEPQLQAQALPNGGSTELQHFALQLRISGPIAQRLSSARPFIVNAPTTSISSTITAGALSTDEGDDLASFTDVTTEVLP